MREVLASRPDVALVDVGLAGMDGYDVARAIRRALANDIRLIAITGCRPPQDRLRALEAGFDEHLLKPLDLEALQRLLGQAGCLSSPPRGAGAPIPFRMSAPRRGAGRCTRTENMLQLDSNQNPGG